MTVETIGYAAAACTTFSFIPQILRIRSHGGASLSYLMLSVYLVGIGGCGWFTGYFSSRMSAIIVANAVSIVLVATAILMKAIVDT